jgi:hypothetical protein
MSCLEATFTLTPRSPVYNKSAQDYAYIHAVGVDFDVYPPADFSSLYAQDRFYFGVFPSDPSLDYTQWTNRRRARAIGFYMDLTVYAGTQKQLALIFGFDVRLPSPPGGRVLVYSFAGLLGDQILVYGDNQFLIEIESLDEPLSLYFIHASSPWFFTGLSGYLV